jgi:hypothetical protein
MRPREETPGQRVNIYQSDWHDHMPEAEVEHNVVRRHRPIRSIMQASHRYYSLDATRSRDNIMDPIGMRIQEVISFSAGQRSSRAQSELDYHYCKTEVPIGMTHVIRAKSESEHKSVTKSSRFH